MRLTSESSEETELSLEFEFTTGIRLPFRETLKPKGGEDDASDHFLRKVPGEVLGSHWGIWRDNYYATASLFEDGKPKSFNLLGDGKPNDATEFGIDTLSDDPVRHHEPFILKSKAEVKFTSIFKLHYGKFPDTPPQYFDISPHLEPFEDRWWCFKTESSSFIFRRHLEAILSHAMPLPNPDREVYQPYVLHNHDLVNMHPTWCSFLNQAFYLLEIDKALQQQNTADDETKHDYRERIWKVIFGCFTFLLGEAERNGPGNVSPYQPADLALPVKPDEAGEVVGGEGIEEERVGLTGTAENPSVAKVAETARPAGASAAEVYWADPMRPIEPELFKYRYCFEDCLRLLILLDKCLTNYRDAKPLITRMVECFLKLAWEPIEMSKHGESRLWPDWLEPLELPPRYARFKDLRDVENCGYGGQGIYVYDITTQVLVWRAAKSTNRLLDLVSGERDWNEWMVHQSLDDKAIRDRTIEVFLRPGTGTSQGFFPNCFISKIRGHVREPFLEKQACTIFIPSLVDDFFDDSNKPMAALTETLKYCYTLNDYSKAQSSETWRSFMRYQVAIGRDRRQELREILETRAYSVGLFPGDTVTLGSHCPRTTAWDVVTYLLNADYTELTYPQATGLHTRADGAQGSTLPQGELMNIGTNSGANIGVGDYQDGRQSGKKGDGLGITAGDPPSYGERYWFREPLFMNHRPKELQMNTEFIETFLEQGINWGCFWESSEGMTSFMESMADKLLYFWGEQNWLVQPYRNRGSVAYRGSMALLKLQEQRDRKVDRKRIIIMEDCMIEDLIALMASLDFQECSYIGEFLSRLRLADSFEMKFAEQTIMPDNLWITEFNINFISAPEMADIGLPPLPNRFLKKRTMFWRVGGDFVQGYIMAEGAMGFRIIGDLHDRYWTCYVFYDFGSEELMSDARTEVRNTVYGNSWSQRKCLEGLLVRQALDIVLLETKKILSILTKSMGGGNKKSEILFNSSLTEDDFSQENYAGTVKKSNIFYPWLLEVYGGLRDKCFESCSVAEQWISAEDTREYEPRWSEKNKTTFREEVVNNKKDVKIRCDKLRKIAKDLKERIERIETLKESLSNELSLREARTSTQLARTSIKLAYTVNIFATVTIIYLPLTFSATIVAIQDFHWQSPTKALIRITLAVSFGTVILLTNVALLRRGFADLKTWVYSSIRLRMVEASESSRASKEFVYQEKRPAWTYWDKRATRLYVAEQRRLLMPNVTSGRESYWWYWYFVVIFIIIVVPVQELTFIIRTLRLQKIKYAGPLKKVVRIPWAPIWVLQLALVYVVMLIGDALLLLVGLVHRMLVRLWTGDDIVEDKTDAPYEAGKSFVSQLEGDKKILRTKPDSTQKGRGLVGWLRKPAKIMQLLIVAEAFRSKKKKEFDAEK
ncbi:hypothetical protein HOY82DRAFT_492662 [Tuber indicum]|nr:hypothetical protein HOY82DRAFT_492662 [Tuber indicum]